jgi:O-antigen/teichoic acid export membrane protein
MLYPCLSAHGLARWGIAAFAAGCAIAAAAFWLLTPPLGLVGAGSAYVMAQLAAVAVIVAAYRRRFGFTVAAVLLPQAEDARSVRDVAASLRRRLTG